MVVAHIYTCIWKGRDPLLMCFRLILYFELIASCSYGYRSSLELGQPYWFLLTTLAFGTFVHRIWIHGIWAKKFMSVSLILRLTNPKLLCLIISYIVDYFHLYRSKISKIWRKVFIHLSFTCLLKFILTDNSCKRN